MTTSRPGNALTSADSARVRVSPDHGRRRVRGQILAILLHGGPFGDHHLKFYEAQDNLFLDALDKTAN